MKNSIFYITQNRAGRLSLISNRKRKMAELKQFEVAALFLVSNFY